MNSLSKKDECCGRGGSRPGCGRKPGVKTRPVRLPEWLLDALEEQGDARHAIVHACVHHFNLKCPNPSEGNND
ncbi:hypothetical protein [Reinekea sp. G2M2-21]|uniref:hypothetical protein n=1 Tax=Reinekea sp. G2M2-21 TaxID=2788942 RepID=UPI0018A99DB5|nr:hypothetical protein [Reinekea sp. G2M2-21]